MKLFIMTTDKDRSLLTLSSAAGKYALPVRIYFYHLFSFADGKILYDGHPLRIGKADKLLLRWPWDAEDTRKEYTFFADYFVDNYFDQVILDKACLKDFSPQYEDKLFQASLFSKLHIKSPTTWQGAERDGIPIPFPLVMKKRIGSRSKQTYLITSKKDFEKKTQNILFRDYLFQDYIPFVHDLRLLVYKNTFLGAVSRTPHIRRNNRLTVKGGTKFANISKKMINDCLTYTEFIGADFVGFDVLLGKDGKHYMIEANLSPQFDKFEIRTGVKVAEKIMQEIS